MNQTQFDMTMTGRYTDICTPVRLQANVDHLVARKYSFVVSIHGQMILFMLFAIGVGAALLFAVPKLSAGRSISEIAEAESPSGESLGALEAANSEDNLRDWSDDGQLSKSGQTETQSMSAMSPVFTREVKYWESKILEWSAKYELDPDIIATIMQIESCGDPGAASYAGAQGLFQVMPFHFDAGEDMLDPDTNAMRGLAFFNRQLDYTGRNIYLSFAGYNGGYAASGSGYNYWANETQRYYIWAKGIYDDAKAGLVESPTLQQWLLAGGGGGCQRAAQRLGF